MRRLSSLSAILHLLSLSSSLSFTPIRNPRRILFQFHHATTIPPTFTLRAPIDQPLRRPSAIRMGFTNLLSDGVGSVLETIDKSILKRLVRFANHIPALASLALFGLVSTSSMMGPSMLVESEATLASVLTKYVGPTSNAEFSALFPTLVTPANFVFLIWPLISVFQLVTIGVSALKPGGAILSQGDLTSLSLANAAATSWILLASRAAANLPPPFGCALILPAVPILSGYTLRNPPYFSSASPRFGKLVYQVFTSFTTLASYLALAVELQHGGRFPFFQNRPELCAGVFLSFTAATVLMPRQGVVRKVVTAGALIGILWKRIVPILVSGGYGALMNLLLSASFWGTLVVTLWALGRLFDKNDRYGDF